MQAYNTGFSGESKIQGLPEHYNGFKVNLGNLVRLCLKLSKRVSMESVVKMHALGSRFRPTVPGNNHSPECVKVLCSVPSDHEVLRCIHTLTLYSDKFVLGTEKCIWVYFSKAQTSSPLVTFCAWFKISCFFSILSSALGRWAAVLCERGIHTTAVMSHNWN